MDESFLVHTGISWSRPGRKIESNSSSRITRKEPDYPNRSVGIRISQWRLRCLRWKDILAYASDPSFGLLASFDAAGTDAVRDDLHRCEANTTIIGTAELSEVIRQEESE
jgi:hypothetical protein